MKLLVATLLAAVVLCVPPRAQDPPADAPAPRAVLVTGASSGIGRKTTELLPTSTYKEYPTAGHGIYVSHHGEINADILEFIKN